MITMKFSVSKCDKVPHRKALTHFIITRHSVDWYRELGILQSLIFRIFFNTYVKTFKVNIRIKLILKKFNFL